MNFSLFARVLCPVLCATGAMAQAQGNEPISTTVSIVTGSHWDPFISVGGVPISVSNAGTPVYSGTTYESGLTEPFTSNAGDHLTISLGQAFAVIDSRPEWDGHVVGKVIEVDMPANYDASKSNVHTQVLSQPFARNVLVSATESDDHLLPEDSRWWKLTVRENAGISFRASIAALLNTGDIDGVFRYLSGSNAPNDYIFGLYVDTAGADLGVGNTLLSMKFNGKDYTATAVADIFHFTSPSMPFPTTPLSATVIGSTPDPDSSMAVYLSGMVPSGKTLIMFREFNNQAPTTTISSLPQLPPIASPLMRNRRSSGAGSGSFPSLPCKACKPKPSQQFINTHAGGCTPIVPSDCPTTPSPKINWLVWHQVGAVIATDDADLRPDFSGSLGETVTIEAGATIQGISFKAGSRTTATVTQGLTLGRDLDSSGCGESAALFAAWGMSSISYSTFEGRWDVSLWPSQAFELPDVSYTRCIEPVTGVSMCWGSPIVTISTCKSTQ